MISSPTPDILQNLKGVLDKVMKNGHTKTKYLSALQDAIDELTQDDVSLVIDNFAVNVSASDNGGVIIDVFSKDGPLIDTLEYDNDCLIDDEMAGEA